MHIVEVFEAWGFEVLTNTSSHVCWLVGPRHRGSWARWDAHDTRCRRYLLHYWTIPPRRGSKVIISWGRWRNHHRGKYRCNCLLDTLNITSKILVNSIQILTLRVIILVLARIVGLTSLHKAFDPLMFYVVDFMITTMYHWRKSLLSAMKQQLIDYKLAKKKNFMFSIILSSLFFERVLGHSPRFDVPPHSLRDMTQTCWVEVMR